MSKPKINALWDLKVDYDFDKQIEIFIDNFSYNEIPENTIRIIIVQEPFVINNFRNILMNRNNDKFYTYAFTYDDFLLTHHNKCSLFLGIYTWIKNFNKEKKFGVSTLVGGKSNYMLEGYRLRHEVYHRKNEINIPKDVYLSSHCAYPHGNYSNDLILYDDKSIMFDNQYHITIENTAVNNMFTEKLIDCFQTKTIPIYYGCPNIDKYFNVEGMIIVKSVDEIINHANKLTPELYDKKLEAIEENYNLSIKYLSYDDLLINKINEIIH